MPLDPARTVAELRELQELTGDENGAQRVAWTDTWQRAREWLRAKLEDLPLVEESDEAGNQWFTLRGASPRAVVLGGHIDSVPNGGWLDGCLNVLGAVEVLRRIAGEGQPPVTVRLVNWADEEGARFGRSLFGSSAAAGSMADQDELRKLTDRDSLGERDAVAIGQLAQLVLVGHRASGGRRAEERAAEARALLVRPVDEPDGDGRRPVLRDSAENLRACEDVEAAVEPAAVRDGVHVTADQDGPVGIAAQRVPVVPGRVALDLERQVGQRLGEPGAPLRPGVRPRDALLAVLVAGQRSQLPKPRDDACGVERHGASLTP